MSIGKRGSEAISKAYDDGWNHYGDLNLTLDTFAKHLTSILHKHLGSDPAEHHAVALVLSLFCNDLFLSCACAVRSEVAWRRFEADYRNYANDVATRFCIYNDSAGDAGCSVFGYLFLPDRSGQSRIASYDGRCSLAAWLRVVIERRALNERREIWNTLERLDEVREIVDLGFSQRIHAGVRSRTYGPMIMGAFKKATACLSDSDRLLLLLRYDQNIQGCEIARINGVHPSTITRRLQQIHSRLKSEIITALSNEGGLKDKAIKDCVSDIIENPTHSLLALIKP